jgi:maleate cis-trans isomerase
MDEPYRIGVLSPPKWFNYCAEELAVAGRGALRVMNAQIRVSRAFDYGLDDIRAASGEVRDAALSLADSDTHFVVQIGTPFATVHGWKGACELEAKIDADMGLPFEMMGLSLPRACHDLGIESVTVGTVFYIPEWTQSYVAFLKEAGLDPLYAGSFSDLGVLDQVTMLQSAMGHKLCTPEVLRETVSRCCDRAPDAQAVLLT